eukprot:scaffold20661_cov18-Tisochrysis_lutea.AAC.1
MALSTAFPRAELTPGAQWHCLLLQHNGTEHSLNLKQSLPLSAMAPKGQADAHASINLCAFRVMQGAVRPNASPGGRKGLACQYSLAFKPVPS